MEKTELNEETSSENPQSNKNNMKRTSREGAKIQNCREINTSPLHGLWALTNRDLRKWYTNPTQLFVSLIQPISLAWLVRESLEFWNVHFRVRSHPSTTEPNFEELFRNNKLLLILGMRNACFHRPLHFRVQRNVSSLRP